MFMIKMIFYVLIAFFLAKGGITIVQDTVLYMAILLSVIAIDTLSTIEE